MRPQRAGAMLAVASALIAPGFGKAQQPATMPGMNMPAAIPDRPGLGDLMTAFVQPRHIKLALAGAQKNWPYAAYELNELNETFERVAKLVPRHGNLVIPDALAATVKQPMDVLGRAIKAQDAAAFTAAYADLTAACNACHASADHPVIVIQVPTASPFVDQDFAPPKK